MTRTEFNKWLSDYCLSYPETRTWVASLGPADVQVMTLDKWHQCFVGKRITLDMALRATKAMFAGDAESPPAYARELTPAYIVKACRELRISSGRPQMTEEELARAIENKTERRYVRPAPLQSTWDLAESYGSLKRSGASAMELSQWLDRNVT